MRISGFGSCALTSCMALAMLAGCGRSQSSLPYMQSSTALRVLDATGAGKITHIVYIVQENRSFNDLFNGYPGAYTVQSGKISTGKMIKLQPIHGFAAETTASLIIGAASHFGVPVSTTQVISSSILGVGATRRLSAVRWGVVGNIVWAWVLTLPLTFALAALLMRIYRAVLG